MAIVLINIWLILLCINVFLAIGSDDIHAVLVWLCSLILALILISKTL